MTCIKCGCNFEIPLNSSKKICNKCKNKKVCWYCGKEKTEENCKNCNFCKIHNHQQVKTLVNHFNFDKNTIGTENFFKEWNRIHDILADMYWNKEYSCFDIAKEFNYKNAGNITGKIFRYLGIECRNYREAIMTAIKNNRFNPMIYLKNNYKTEYHKTWNGKTYFLRSSYETNYAEYLDKNKIDYQVEFSKIKYFNSVDKKYHFAVPDFYIPSNNMIVEIKSTFTLNVQEMIDKFRSYKDLGYNVKLILDNKEQDLYKMPP